MTLKVILDANMFMNISQKKIDIFEEIERLLLGRVNFVILRPVLEELRRLASESSMTGKQASLALKMTHRCEIPDVNPQRGESTDRFILRFASETNGIVATGDSQIISEARNANIPLIYLKERSRLALEGLEPAYR